jgi:hypothetical protein
MIRRNHTMRAGILFCRSAFRAASVALALVFLLAPTLTRAADRTPIHHETAGFRFSKNIERPHEKFSAAPLITLGGSSTAEPLLRVECLFEPDASVPPFRAFLFRTPDRAPPAR